MKDLEDQDSPVRDEPIDRRQMGLRVLARMIARDLLNLENPLAIEDDKSQNEQSNDNRAC
jgi:hypothetical protein